MRTKIFIRLFFSTGLHNYENVTIPAQRAQSPCTMQTKINIGRHLEHIKKIIAAVLVN